MSVYVSLCLSMSLSPSRQTRVTRWRVGPLLAATPYEVRSDETINSIRQKRAPGTSVHTAGGEAAREVSVSSFRPSPGGCVRDNALTASTDAAPRAARLRGCRIKKINRVIPVRVHGKSGEPCFSRPLHPGCRPEDKSVVVMRCSTNERDTRGYHRMATRGRAEDSA